MDYRTIKALVFDFVHCHRGKVDYDALTKQVQAHFPESQWKESHWAWYRSQIRSGRFKSQFSDEVRENLKKHGKVSVPALSPSAKTTRVDGQTASRRGRQPKDPKVKELGDEILKLARAAIKSAADDDIDLHFRINRWVFARLHQDEIRVKQPIKKALFKSGIAACQACGQQFASPKGVELHRKNAAAGYSIENCELLCRDCHSELHRGS